MGSLDVIFNYSYDFIKSGFGYCGKLKAHALQNELEGFRYLKNTTSVDTVLEHCVRSSLETFFMYLFHVL